MYKKHDARAKLLFCVINLFLFPSPSSLLKLPIISHHTAPSARPSCTIARCVFQTISSCRSRCPVDNGTKYDHTLTPTQRFRLDPFRWVPENYTLVYLHCNVIVCQKYGSTRCSMGCQPDSRRARSIGKDEIHRVTLGPIRLRKSQQSTPERGKL